jgi:large conductance mechanosensitive channel
MATLARLDRDLSSRAGCCTNALRAGSGRSSPPATMRHRSQAGMTGGPATARQINQRSLEKQMGMLKEFRDFAVKGNVIDLAVGVIIGGAFGTIVNSAVKDLIMPIIGSLGSVDFKEYFVILSKPANYAGPMTYDALSKAGVPLFAYGQFLTILLNFIILAFIIFWMVKAVNRVKAAAIKEEAKAPAAPPEDVVLLREIRDSLKK